MRGAVLLLLPVTTAEVALSTRQELFSWDEGDHIYYGYTNYTEAMRRVADMEPSAQERWRHEIAKKPTAVGSGD